jgi:hypothetical protein
MDSELEIDPDKSEEKEGVLSGEVKAYESNPKDKDHLREDSVPVGV